jgi:hypothetical protein
MNREHDVLVAPRDRFLVGISRRRLTSPLGAKRKWAGQQSTSLRSRMTLGRHCNIHYLVIFSGGKNDGLPLAVSVS